MTSKDDTDDMWSVGFQVLDISLECFKSLRPNLQRFPLYLDFNLDASYQMNSQYIESLYLKTKPGSQVKFT